jgi:hypothetical protein
MFLLFVTNSCCIQFASKNSYSIRFAKENNTRLVKTCDTVAASLNQYS